MKRIPLYGEERRNYQAYILTQIIEAYEEQSTAIAQVSEGINQISDVVQNNSTTAQETAASSEELSAQAQLLNQMVEKFTIK